MSKTQDNESKDPELVAIEQSFRVENLTRVLDFRKRSLSSLPTNLEEFQAVEEIVLAQNNFITIPSLLFKLSNLKSCNMESNQISEIKNKKSTFSKWKQLKYLNLANNLISEIPPSFKYLSSIKQLELEHNQLKQLPTEICSLKSLEILNISNNLIEGLPIEISNMINLRTLAADCNKIMSFPAFPEDLSNLHLSFVSVTNNPIKLPDTTLSRFLALGIRVHPDYKTTPALSQTDVSGKRRSINLRRSNSHGNDKEVDEIISPNPPSPYGLAQKIQKNIKNSTVRARSRTDAPVLGSKRKPIQNTALKYNLITLTSTSKNSTTEMDILPKEIKSIAPIEFACVENESASVEFATKEQLVSLLTYDSGIGKFVKQIEKIILYLFIT